MLRLQLLGGFRALVDGNEVRALSKQPRRAALLAYLAVERDVPRDRVLAMLWPDADTERARHSLNQAIYFLRRLIGADWVDLRGDRCVIAPWVSTDVQELEQAAGSGAHADVVGLYQGPLLFSTVRATAEFDMWVDSRRAVIDRLHRRSRRQLLAELTAAGRLQDALQCAEEWCVLDPLEDEAQHRYMQLLASSGQRGAALRQFDVYRRILAEHELRPLDETIALVEQLQQGEFAALPAAPDIMPRRDAAPAAPLRAAAPWDAHAELQRNRTLPRRIAPLLQSRAGLCTLLAGVFVFNLAESTLEAWLAPKLPAIAELRLQLARAAHWLEGYLSFEQHELTNQLAVIGFSTAYFFALPLLLAWVGVSLARRRSIRPFRVFSLAVVIDYLVSLPFYLLFPVPERWWHTQAEAIVLSDRLTTMLLELFRPMSALDNSFPSFHVSLTVLLVLSAFVFGMRLRWTVLALGTCIVLATFALGIHWLTDLVAGAATGIIALALALRLERGMVQPTPVQPRVPRQVPVHAAAVQEISA